MGVRAFANCRSLRCIEVFGDIQQECFKDCVSLQSIICDLAVFIDETAFIGCKLL
jgi:hypothetical protein